MVFGLRVWTPQLWVADLGGYDLGMMEVSFRALKRTH